MDIGRRRLRALVLTTAAGVLATLLSTASATPIRPNGESGASDSAMPACQLFSESARGYASGCDPDFNADGGVDALDIGRVGRGFVGGVNPNDSAFGFSMRFSRPGERYISPGAPLGRGGIRVTEPSSALLLLAGSLAWRFARRRRR
jgi:hypothetical protein